VAGLLTRSLQKMEHQEFGFHTDPRVNISLFQVLSGEAERHYRDLQDRLSQIPGVQRAALALYTSFTDKWDEMVIREGAGNTQRE
jgi:hypothetical protein